MDIFSNLEHKLTSIKKFYFLEYFYVVLFCIKNNENPDKVFENFKILKEQNQLGESKYKKPTSNIETINSKIENRYRYTFNQVVDEALVYELINKKNYDEYELTTQGEQLLSIYKNGKKHDFYKEIFKLIETKTNGFNFIVNFCYETNPLRNGLLIFPVYSPLKLGFSKSDLINVNVFYNYLEKLYLQLENDIKKHLDKSLSLENASKDLIGKLLEADLLPLNNSESIDLEKYNLIIKRVRDYWLSYFLKDIYKTDFSFSYFDLWSYRAKHLGILNTTEFYPDFSGRIVYPISIISKSVRNPDFINIYQYANNSKLFVHEPSWENFQETFVASVYDSYLDLKKSYRSYFLSLLDLREIVCYKTKISYDKFVDFLTLAYNLNLRNELQIKISLEADKLPSESALYLKREPISIDGKPRNIIAIDLKK